MPIQTDFQKQRLTSWTHLSAGYQAGGVRGGQLMTTSEVENFPGMCLHRLEDESRMRRSCAMCISVTRCSLPTAGFPEGITGPDLMERMAAQVCWLPWQAASRVVIPSMTVVLLTDALLWHESGRAVGLAAAP